MGFTMEGAEGFFYSGGFGLYQQDQYRPDVEQMISISFFLHLFSRGHKEGSSVDHLSYFLKIDKIRHPRLSLMGFRISGANHQSPVGSGRISQGWRSFMVALA